ncbi:helix-turn-helix transcriptional regulator [Noviherbaspirillum autotrophicum]|uniref:helix-turn-helix transcriptional regulator n=1 Tax=Noviherbaspirillum autotrophicum TaxID=709839 RepID=UPI000A076EC1|nr:AlpA family transcriptional regulator [Noviherbaspirillum autotrophicum]
MEQHQIIRLPAVLARTGLSRSSIYAAISRNEFPASIPLGARAVGWLTSDIDGWLQSRVQLSRSACR